MTFFLLSGQISLKSFSGIKIWEYPSIVQVRTASADGLQKKRQAMPQLPNYLSERTMFECIRSGLDQLPCSTVSSWFFLAIDAASSCSYNFLRALSFASLRGTFVYKLFTSRDITFSLSSRLMLSMISLAFSELILMFAPSIFSKIFARQ